VIVSLFATLLRVVEDGGRFALSMANKLMERLAIHMAFSRCRPFYNYHGLFVM
jgi:hypothetical protein